VDVGKHASITGKLHGKNLTPLLEKGTAAGVNDVRAGSLYCINMFAFLDSNLLRRTQALLITFRQGWT
jgi:hypothetical protein